MARKTKAQPENIGNIVDNVLSGIEKKGPGKKEKILNIWQKAAGEKAAAHSRPVNIKRKILTIEVDSSTWFYFLNMKKNRLLADINKKMGKDKVKDLRLRMGDIT